MKFCLLKQFRCFLFFSFLIICLTAGYAFAGGFEAASGGMSNDQQASGLFAATGTGGGGTGGVQVNLSAVIDDSGASYLQGNQVVSPRIVLSASEPVDVYVSVVLGDIVVGYNPCSEFGANPWTPNFTPCFTDSLDLTLFNYKAASLAAISPEDIFIPFGVFVRVVEAGTGINGNTLKEASVLTYIANLPSMPAPASAPWPTSAP